MCFAASIPPNEDAVNPKSSTWSPSHRHGEGGFSAASPTFRVISGVLVSRLRRQTDFSAEGLAVERGGQSLWLKRANHTLRARCRFPPWAESELRPNVWICPDTHPASPRDPSESSPMPAPTLQPAPDTSSSPGEAVPWASWIG